MHSLSVHIKQTTSLAALVHLFVQFSRRLSFSFCSPWAFFYYVVPSSLPVLAKYAYTGKLL